MAGKPKKKGGPRGDAFGGLHESSILHGKGRKGAFVGRQNLGSGERQRMAHQEGLAEMDEAHRQAIQEASAKLDQNADIPSSDYGKVLQTMRRKERVRKLRRGE